MTVNNVGYHNVTKLYSWGEANSHQLFVSQSPYALNIPHGLALAESLGLICVADRENGRVQCYRISDAQFEKSVQLKEFSSTIYGIDFNEKGTKYFILVTRRPDHAMSPVYSYSLHWVLQLWILLPIWI